MSSAVTGRRSAIRYEISESWRISFSVSFAMCPSNCSWGGASAGPWRGGGWRYLRPFDTWRDDGVTGGRSDLWWIGWRWRWRWRALARRALARGGRWRGADFMAGDSRPAGASRPQPDWRGSVNGAGEEKGGGRPRTRPEPAQRDNPGRMARPAALYMKSMGNTTGLGPGAGVVVLCRFPVTLSAQRRGFGRRSGRPRLWRPAGPPPTLSPCAFTEPTVPVKGAGEGEGSGATAPAENLHSTTIPRQRRGLPRCT